MTKMTEIPILIISSIHFHHRIHREIVIMLKVVEIEIELSFEMVLVSE